MADVVDAKTRSRMMSGIRGKNTKPELIVRRYLHAAGFRFRLHVQDLHGKPDIVLPKYRTIVFIHGCFWHGHDCHLFKWPASNSEFWKTKIGKNRELDNKTVEALKSKGWKVITIWECSLRQKGEDLKLTLDELAARITGPQQI